MTGEIAMPPHLQGTLALPLSRATQGSGAAASGMVAAAIVVRPPGIRPVGRFR